MKKIIVLAVFSVAGLMLTGCYTQIATSNSDENYSDGPIIIILPSPPHEFPPEPIPPTYNPPPQKEKIRNPEPPPSTKDNTRDKLRNSGGRNNQGNRNRR